ncbi:unnamed protein product [Rangifer tarandus platyrhynchus]|uniref:Uncharacterized protein n=1 Tax=Rangifer tarandus platyrhynchus TaxID=3082113 RepID=A0ABN8YS54_RANTA|nr:unnamed protein product [Rangifer tarandus platyrhynchus]
MRVLWSLPRRVLRSRPVRLGGRIPGRRRAPHSQALTALAPGLQRPPPSCQAPHHTWNNHKEQLQRPGPPARAEMNYVTDESYVVVPNIIGIISSIKSNSFAPGSPRRLCPSALTWLFLWDCAEAALLRWIHP